MRKILAVTLSLCILPIHADEKVMNIQKKDGTTMQTRVADLKQINFLTTNEGGQGLLVKTQDGETAAILFKTVPVVTIASGKLTVKSTYADPVEFEITDIAEIQFGDKSSEVGAINLPKGLTCVLQEGGTLLRGIPEGVQPRLYSLDGRNLPTPPVEEGELQLNRSTLGSGVFIVKIGSLATKIKL